MSESWNRSGHYSNGFGGRLFPVLITLSPDWMSQLSNLPGDKQAKWSKSRVLDFVFSNTLRSEDALAEHEPA